MKLVGRYIVQKSRPSSNLGVIASLGAHPPPNVAFVYDVGKISAGCLVLNNSVLIYVSICLSMFVAGRFSPLQTAGQPRLTAGVTYL